MWDRDQLINSILPGSINKSRRKFAVGRVAWLRAGKVVKVGLLNWTRRAD